MDSIDRSLLSILKVESRESIRFWARYTDLNICVWNLIRSIRWAWLELGHMLVRFMILIERRIQPYMICAIPWEFVLGDEEHQEHDECSRFSFQEAFWSMFPASTFEKVFPACTDQLHDATAFSETGRFAPGYPYLPNCHCVHHFHFYH